MVYGFGCDHELGRVVDFEGGRDLIVGKSCFSAMWKYGWEVSK